MPSVTVPDILAKPLFVMYCHNLSLLLQSNPLLFLTNSVLLLGMNSPSFSPKGSNFCVLFEKTILRTRRA